LRLLGGYDDGSHHQCRDRKAQDERAFHGKSSVRDV
jgi:hypothetical protein